MCWGLVGAVKIRDLSWVTGVLAPSKSYDRFSTFRPSGVEVVENHALPMLGFYLCCDQKR